MADGDGMEVEEFTVYINWRQGLERGGRRGAGVNQKVEGKEKSEGGREGGEK